MSTKPEVSVIIPNLNSPIIDRVLLALQNQEYDMSKVEVLVVGLDELRLVANTQMARMISTGVPKQPAVARNIGARSSQGDILCFLDADCIPHPRWLRTLLAWYENPDVAIVGGGVDFPSGGYWRLADNIATFYPYLSTAPRGMREQLPSLNLSLRREVWERVGPFDERYPLPAGEDADWTTRARLAGYRLYFEPEAVVIHLPLREGIRDLWRHAVNFGRYSIKVDARYRKSLKFSYVFSHWILLLVLSPFLSALVTARVFSNIHLWRYIYAIPAIYLAKLGWCWGASAHLREKSNFNMER